MWLLLFLFLNSSNIPTSEQYLNVSVASPILLTTPITVASGERSFYKRWLIETYLRSTISESRLIQLLTFLIEVENIDFDNPRKKFIWRGVEI